MGVQFPHELFAMKDYLDRMKFFLSGRSIAQTMSVIAKAGLFDARAYASQAPEAARSGMDPLRHYVVFGAAAGLSPHPLFDARWYLSQYPCDAQARANPLLHYLRRGAREDRDPHPLFDTAWYRRQKPDLAIAGGNPLIHFVNYALSEPHDPNALFDTCWYLKRNPDVAAARLNPLAHYVTAGAGEGRNPHPLFDSEWYLHHNPEVAAAGLNPLTHYLTRGVSARAGPNPLFDTAWYLAQNPDVAWAHENPLVHYITTGASEGRDPNPLFDTDWYLEQNPDVALAGTNPLAHYIDPGVSEGRDPNPLFDTDWYLERNPEVARARINPVAHYLAGAYGWCEPNWWFDTHSYVAMNPDAGAAGVNPLAHYLAANSRAQRRRDAAFAAARRALPGLAAAEPKLAPIAAQLNNLRYITGHARGLGFARWRDLLHSFAQVYDRLIFMPQIEEGAAGRAGMNALRAAQQCSRSDSTLLIVTDGRDACGDDLRVPKGTPVRVLSQLDARLTEEDRMQITLALIYHLQPKAVLNVESAILSRVIEQRGLALARVTRLYGYLCQLRSPEACLQCEHDWLSHLSRIYFDNAVLMSLFVRDHGTLQDRFVLLPQPPSIREDALADQCAEDVSDPRQTASETERRSLRIGADSIDRTSSWGSYFKLFADSPSFLD
jgi:hypothetical protein